MQRDCTSPDQFRIPTVGELDQIRQGYSLSKRELSRRAGFEDQRFRHLVNRDVDPRVSTLRAFLTALQDADRNGPRATGGRPNKDIPSIAKLREGGDD